MTAPIDPARLAATVGVLIAAVTALVLAASGSPDTPSAVEVDRAAATPERGDVAARLGDGGDPTQVTVDPTPDAVDRPPSTRDRADAEAVAAAFVEQWATAHHDEPPAAAVRRVRPYVTAALADQLLTDLQQPGRAGPSQLEEITEAVVEHVHGQAVTGTQITVVVVARQHARTVEGDTVEHPSFTVALVRDGSRWRVHELIH